MQGRRAGPTGLRKHVRSSLKPNGSLRSAPRARPAAGSAWMTGQFAIFERAGRGRPRRRARSIFCGHDDASVASGVLSGVPTPAAGGGAGFARSDGGMVTAGAHGRSQLPRDDLSHCGSLKVLVRQKLRCLPMIGARRMIESGTSAGPTRRSVAAPEGRGSRAAGVLRIAARLPAPMSALRKVTVDLNDRRPPPIAASERGKSNMSRWLSGWPRSYRVRRSRASTWRKPPPVIRALEGAGARPSPRVPMSWSTHAVLRHWSV